MTLEPIDLDVDELRMSELQADWGMHKPMPVISPLKRVGLTISEYTGRFINPITGLLPKTASAEQRYYAGYAILIGVGILGYWYLWGRK